MSTKDVEESSMKIVPESASKILPESNLKIVTESVAVIKTDPYNATIITPAHPTVSVEKTVPMNCRPPWPEWSDEEINKETWEENDERIHPDTPRINVHIYHNESTSLFEDVTGTVLLPPSIRPAQWIRPTYLNVSPRLVDWTEKTLDLINPNIHLCEVSEAIRYILSEISELFDQAKDNDFKSEGEDEIFVRNSIGPWNPWDHIYSLCKAGVKGAQPLYNPSGRYFVRLYYMGCWRRITVDDRIPILKNGMTGLPLGPNGELWPLILAKALLKIASLTADELHGVEIKEFSSVSCLTGWTHEWHNIVAPITSDELWTDLTDILPKYKQPMALHSKPNSTQSKKQLDDSSSFWWLPPTSLSDPPEQQDFDDFGEPIVATTKPSAVPISPSKEPLDDKNKLMKDRKHQRHKSKRRTKKDSLVESDAAIGMDFDENVPSSVQANDVLADKDAAAQVEKKDKGKKGKDKKKKGLEGDESQTEGVKKKKKSLGGDDSQTDGVKTKKKSKKQIGEGIEEEVEEQKPKENEGDEGADKPEKKSKKKNKEVAEEVEKKSKKKDGGDEVAEGEKKSKKKKNEEAAEGEKKPKKKKKDEGDEEVADDEKKPKKKKKDEGDVEIADDEKKPKKKKKNEGDEVADDEKKVEEEEKKGGKKGKGKDAKKMKKDKKVTVETSEEIKESSQEIVPIREDNKKKSKKNLASKSKELDTETEKDTEGSITSGRKKGKKDKDKDKKSKKRLKSKSKEAPDTIQIQIDAAAALKSELKEKLAKRAERIEKEKAPPPLPERKDESATAIIRQKIPPMQEIMFGVQKYSGIVYHAIIAAFEENSGKDLPVALTVIFNEFPKEENQAMPAVPSFLYHPIQLYEVRDCQLAKTNDRPRTPLWKTFRWKAWAMKKGIIPMEEDHFKDVIRSVKIHTPFVLKTDYYSHNIPIDYPEAYGEDYLEEDDEFYDELKEEFHSPEIVIEMTGSPVLEKTQSTGSPKIVDGSKASFMSGTSNVVGRGQTKSSLESTKHVDTSTAEEEEMPQSQLGVNFMKPVDPARNIYSKSTEMLGETRAGEHFQGPMIEQIVPASACGSLWFDVENLAINLKKFCKFYSGRTTFGSCFTLRRSPRWVFETPVSKGFDQEPTKPVELTNFHSNPRSKNLTIHFGESKTIHVMSHHLDDLDGFDSGFYIFSDSWTEQEMIFDLEVLQLSAIKKFTDAALEIEAIPMDPTVHNDLAILKKLENPKVNITMILEPWDWRNDCCIEAPVVCGTTQTRWTTHVPLPPGRNTFRLWLFQDYPEINTSGFSSFKKLESVRRVMETHKANQITQFSLKVLSKTPMSVGTREETQNYLTNEPVLLLKQCEAFAHNIWTLLLSFGKTLYAHGRALSSVRKSYCPAYSEPNKINRILKCVHWTFEECFVAMITRMNDNMMDKWMLLALRSLLLNPCVGHIQGMSTEKLTRGNPEEFVKLFQGYRKSEKMADVRKAVLQIQRYYRGWRVRRLFQICHKGQGHKYFPRLEFQIRKIALILAKHTDSSFTVTQNKQTEKPDTNATTEERENTAKPVAAAPDIPFPPLLSLIPQPPRWAVDLLRSIMELHPMLITVHPHAYCVPLHVKIKDVEGTLPSFLKDTEWLPFCRQTICMPNEPKWTYCEFDLQIHPRDGIMIKVVDNETMDVLQNITHRLYLGRLPANRLGYTIVCYRWANSSEARPDAYRRPPSKQWKLRIISPQIQKSIQLRDISSSDEDETPKRLTLHRFTGYYIPSQEHCVCRYTLETYDLVTYLSIRFKASNPKAHLSLQILDLTRKTILFAQAAVGALLIPTVRIEGEPPIVPDMAPESDPVEIPVVETLTGMFDLQSTLNLLKTPTESVKNSPNVSKKPTESAFKIIPDLPKEDEESIPEDNSESGFEVNPTALEPKRFLISIFTKQESWNMTDDEWMFGQREKKKFWKRLMVTKKAPKLPGRPPPKRISHVKPPAIISEDLGNLNTEDIEISATGQASVVEVVEAALAFEVKNKLSTASGIKLGKGGKKRMKNAVATVSKERGKSRMMKEKSIGSSSSAAKNANSQIMKPSDKSEGGGRQRQKSTSGKSSAPPIVVTPPPAPPPDPEPFPMIPEVEEEIDLIPPEIEEVFDYEEYERDGYESANVTVRIGGPHSVKINETSQPHWLLEIVVETDQDLEISSNLRIFNDHLETLKKDWEDKQRKMLSAGLVTRAQSVNPKPGTYLLADPFTIIQLLTSLPYSLYLDETLIDKFTYGDLLTPKEAREQTVLEKMAEVTAAAEERLAEIRKSNRTRTGKGKKGTRPPPPTPAETSGARLVSGHGDLFPTPNAGSDFNFDVPCPDDRPAYSIFPIDLSIGSPSFLELTRKLAQTESTASRTTTDPRELSEEMEGEDFEYNDSFHRRAQLYRTFWNNEYHGEGEEGGEGYEDTYRNLVNQFYGKSGSSSSPGNVGHDRLHRFTLSSSASSPNTRIQRTKTKESISEHGIKNSKNSEKGKSSSSGGASVKATVTESRKFSVMPSTGEEIVAAKNEGSF